MRNYFHTYFGSIIGTSYFVALSGLGFFVCSVLFGTYLHEWSSNLFYFTSKTYIFDAFTQVPIKGSYARLISTPGTRSCALTDVGLNMYYTNELKALSKMMILMCLHSVRGRTLDPRVGDRGSIPTWSIEKNRIARCSSYCEAEFAKR